MINPRMNPGSNMPSYPWLFEDDTDVAALPRKLEVQAMLGVPYGKMSPEEVQATVDEQANAIAADLKESGLYIAPEKQIVALIAYLQQLGNYQEVTPGDLAASTAAK